MDFKHTTVYAENHYVYVFIRFIYKVTFTFILYIYIGGYVDNVV